MRTTLPNARFWIWVNGGPVKLTLRPGQELRHYAWWSTDEGWSSESCTWRHDGPQVSRSWCNDGRDCDGQLTRGGDDIAPLDHLAEDESPTDPGIYWPDWRDVSRKQYDEYAEMAGY